MVDILGSRDVIGHMTIGVAICGFLLLVNLNRSLSRTVFEILRLKDIGSRHGPQDRWTHYIWFLIGAQFEPAVYLARLQRY